MRSKSKNRPKGPNLILVVFALSLIVAGVVINFTTLPGTSYTIYNDITVQTALYDVADDGALRQLLSEGDRIFTKVRVEATTDGVLGLDRFTCKLMTDDMITAFQTLTMTAAGNFFHCEFSVDGYATGYYQIKLTGIATSTTHTEDNPDYVKWLDDVEDATAQNDANLLLYLMDREPRDKTITYTTADVDIRTIAPMRVYIKNPDQDMIFTFTSSVASGASTMQEITFALSVTTGTMSEYELVIHDSGWLRVTNTKNLNAFVFNENRGQANGLYHAVIYVVGAPGWIGDSRQIDFTITNPEAMAGEANVFMLNENGVWILVPDGGVLSGEIKIVIDETSGTSDEAIVYVSGANGIETPYQMYKNVDDEWEVIIDTRNLLNGAYVFRAEITRSVDGAVFACSLFDMEISGSQLAPNIVAYAMIGIGIGLLVMAFILPTRRG